MVEKREETQEEASVVTSGEDLLPKSSQDTVLQLMAAIILPTSKVRDSIGTMSPDLIESVLPLLEQERLIAERTRRASTPAEPADSHKGVKDRVFKESALSEKEQWLSLLIHWLNDEKNHRVEA